MSKIKLVAKIMWLFCFRVKYDGLLACGQVAHSFFQWAPAVVAGQVA
jgi:hypothetical protein